jgi:hypothetical protein
MKIYFFFVVAVFYICTSCNHSEPFTDQQKIAVHDSILLLTKSIARNVSIKGAAAWSDFFENTPDFFVASDGKLEFSDYESTSLVNILPTNKIELYWSDIRVDALSPTSAIIGTSFCEDIKETDGNNITKNGYLTATATKTSNGWRLRNLHWSDMNGSR